MYLGTLTRKGIIHLLRSWHCRTTLWYSPIASLFHHSAGPLGLANVLSVVVRWSCLRYAMRRGHESLDCSCREFTPLKLKFALSICLQPQATFIFDLFLVAPADICALICWACSLPPKTLQAASSPHADGANSGHNDSASVPAQPHRLE